MWFNIAQLLEGFPNEFVYVPDWLRDDWNKWHGFESRTLGLGMAVRDAYLLSDNAARLRHAYERFSIPLHNRA